MNKFGSARLYDTTIQSLQAANPFDITPQERVNLEMFKAIELLGRRLERAENERDRLAGRLAQIESAATVDEKTGKLYLPVVVDPRQRKSLSTTPRWMVGATLMSSAIALLALGLAVTREPAASPLSPRQMAALNALATQDAVALATPSRWKSVDEAEKDEDNKLVAEAAAPGDTAKAAAPQSEAPVQAAANIPETPAAKFLALPQPAAGAGVPVAQAINNSVADMAAGLTPAAGTETPQASSVPQGGQDVQAPQTASEGTQTSDGQTVTLQGRITTSPDEGPDTASADTPATASADTPANDSVEDGSESAVQAVEAPAAEKQTEAAAAPSPEKAPEKTVEKVAEKKPEPPKAHVAAAVKAAPAVIAKAQNPAVPVQAAPASVSGAPQIAPDTSLPSKLVELEKSAFAGKPEAQHDLATIYAAGKVVSQDYKRAVYWFSRAADGGIANADYNLGVMFQQGMGVHKDIPHALAWYEKAAQLGHPEAMYNLGIAYVEGVGTGRNVERGVGYFKKAANAGVAQAAYNLGVLYESNFVGPIDLAKAAEWYQVAADQGHLEARHAAERVRQQIADSARTGDQGLKLATTIEPAAGQERPAVKDSGEYGEGDATSPGDLARETTPSQATAVTASGALPQAAALVKKIQAVLIAHGGLQGTPTGVIDQKTEDAISAWQAKLGLPVNGQPSQIFLDKISALPAGQ